MTIVSFRKVTAAAAAALLLAACSDPQGAEPEDVAATPNEATSPQPESPEGGGGGSARTGADGGGGEADGDSTAKGGSGGGPGGRPGSPGSGGRGGFAAGPRGSAPYPAAGDYVYGQDGWEKLCRGPSCNKEPLPKSATTTASYSERSADTAVIVTETRSSEQQKLTTTTRFTPSKALITKVVVDFAYNGFNFAQSYEPQPPVESLLFPLGAHDAWRGRWKARTSGDYRVRVAGREPVTVGGRDVSAYRLETVTNFRGDFSGRAQMSVWIDPETSMVVKTDGQIAVASAFGEYSSNFETTLRSGPGY